MIPRVACPVLFREVEILGRILKICLKLIHQINPFTLCKKGRCEGAVTPVLERSGSAMGRWALPAWHCCSNQGNVIKAFYLPDSRASPFSLH